MLVPVYDILNCGPRRRFVANGKLVHNSDGLNLQNLPRGGELRKAVKAPKGYKIITADLANIELRLGLYMACQDDKLKLIEDGVDLYIDIAVPIFNKSYGEIADLGKKSRERTTGKVVQLSGIFGTGATKMRDTLRIQGKVRFSLEETQSMTDLYRSDYHMVVDAWAQGREVLDALYAKQDYGDFLRPGILQATKEGIMKPSGLLLTYPDLRWTKDKDSGKMGYTYEQKRGARDRVYGSKVFQRCLSPDTEVLTDRGWVKLIEVRGSDKLWDSVDWVTHGGVVLMGDREVIKFAGVDITPDHRVLSANGWEEAQHADVEKCVAYASARTPEVVDAKTST